MNEGSAILVDDIAQELFGGDFPERRIVVQVTDNLSTQ
jgi:hypothetical protein